RRAAHYDFWTDRLRRSILLDAKADLIAYGMSEQTIMTIADRVRNGEPLEAIPGTCGLGTPPADARALPSFEEIQTTPECLLGASQAIEEQVHHGVGTLVQAHGTRHLVINPPAPLLDTAALDDVYDLPFTRRTHPSYALPVPAEEMIRWSITAVRGCGGGCTFCALALHQGRRVRSRSSQSVLKEVRALTKHPQWKGAISDIGGPTANLWGATCDIAPTDCHRPSCLFPSRCRHLRLSQKDYLSLLRQAKSQPGVKHVRVGSGIRFDLAIEDPAFCDGLTAEFVGGQLKLAPEHSVAHVLRLMRKTDFTLFERFRKLFTSANRRAAKEQYIVPYVMSAFPGCRVEDMKALATWFRQQGWRPQQVQCFVPTPGTIATAMFYSEHAPDGTSIHVARTDREREKQHALLIPRAKRR
ncbi:MAG: YgiQ family radical SAM protein, partial [Lentisphaerae bacterium]|nr:YgiQ family radical SAM protein [Lentisphaerota bacterium]